MGIISNIKDFFFNKFYVRELTPSGECFRNYIEELRDGSDSCIEAYEEDIEKVKSAIEEIIGQSISRRDTLDILSVYFEEYF